MRAHGTAAARYAPAPVGLPEAPSVALESGGVELVDGSADEWRQLCAEAADDQPFYRPEWIAAYLRAFEPDASVVLLTARANGRLCGVLPLVSERVRLHGLAVRRLRSPSNDHSGRYDFVRRRGSEGDAAVRAIWGALGELPDWDVLEFKDVPAGGGVEQLAGAAQADGFPIAQKASLRSPRLPFNGWDGSEDWWLRQVSANLRHSLRRVGRKIAAEGELTLRRIEAPDAETLRRFYEMESAGWKGECGSAIARRESTRRFYDEVAQSAGRFGYMSLYLLELDGRLLAAHFGLAYGGRYFMPKCAIDEKAKPFSPGHLLIHAVLQDAARRGLTEFDFMGADDEYKMKWASGVRSHASWFVFRKSLYGRFLYAVRFQAKAIAKKLLRPRPKTA